MRPVLQVPSRFGSLNMVKFHVQQHHGYWFGDVKTLREGVEAHAEMHSDPAPIPRGFSGPYPHVHADVDELTVLRFD